MPAYHSAFNDKGVAEVCGCAVLPLKTKVRGPAPNLEASDEEDIVDEAIRLFRANVLFRTFDPKGGADRVLAYLTLFIHQCLKKAEKEKSKAEAMRSLTAMAQGPHVSPGEAGWPLQSFLTPAKSAADNETLRGYLKQLREATVARLEPVLYGADGTPNKHWLAFSKRKFMNREFV